MARRCLISIFGSDFPNFSTLRLQTRPTAVRETSSSSFVALYIPDTMLYRQHSRCSPTQHYSEQHVFPLLFRSCRDTTGIPPSNSNLLVRNVKSKPEYVKLLLFLGTDQGLLNDVYGNSWRTVPIRRLPYTYNMAYSTFKIYRSAYDRYVIRL